MKAPGLCVAGILMAASGSAAQAHAQDVDPATVMLLESSEVERVLGGVHGDVVGLLASWGVEPTEEQTEVLAEVFSVESLLPIMALEFEGMGDSSTRAAAAELVSGGAIAQVRASAAAEPPATTMDEYVATLQTDPPPQSRIQLMSQMAIAQSAGAFYVLLDQRTREAAHRVAEALGASVEPFQPLTQREWMGRAEQGHMQALVSFLHRNENVPDALLEASMDDWLSPAGAWFVEAYSVALGETLLAAADTVAVRLAPRNEGDIDETHLVERRRNHE